MKTVLNLVLSCDRPPYDKMVDTSESTWNTVDVEGVETVYYFGKSDKPDTNNKIYLPINESLNTMGYKLILAFEWALKNKQFDYLARPHSCIYVNKKELVNYVQSLPDNNVFAGLSVIDLPPWKWGGIGFILSRDVVEKVVANKHLFQHDKMEDMGLSYLINDLQIPYTDGKGCSIDNMGDKWRCMMYGGGESFEFTDFKDTKKSEGQYFYRIKQDGNRYIEDFLMHELFKNLNQ